MGLLHHGKPWPLLLGLASGAAVFYSSVVQSHPIIGFACIGAALAHDFGAANPTTFPPGSRM